jgi:hypothetical protein
MQAEDHDTDDRLGVTCDDCRQQVTLRRKPSGQLLVTCGCDEQRLIRVAAALPSGWQP